MTIQIKYATDSLTKLNCKSVAVFHPSSRIAEDLDNYKLITACMAKSTFIIHCFFLAVVSTYRANCKFEN